MGFTTDSMSSSRTPSPPVDLVNANPAMRTPRDDKTCQPPRTRSQRCQSRSAHLRSPYRCKTLRCGNRSCPSPPSPFPNQSRGCTNQRCGTPDVHLNQAQCGAKLVDVNDASLNGVTPALKDVRPHLVLPKPISRVDLDPLSG